MSLPALPVTADTRSITERVNVLIRDYNTMLRVPAGCVMPFAGATPPDGWLLCYGQAVSRTSYSDLFAAIGTTYGAGDGSTTFNLPDLRGRVAAGKDDMGGSAAGRLTSAVSGATLGASGGEQSHTLSASTTLGTGPRLSTAAEAGEKRCLIWLVGGSRLREWAADFIAKLEDWARSLGCVALRGVGRPGWARIVKKFGGVSVDAVDGLPAWERRIA